MTQWSLIGLIAIRPENCAFYLNDSMNLKENSNIKNTDKDKYYVLGEMIYFWRVTGYCMGKYLNKFKRQIYSRCILKIKFIIFI